MAENLPQHSEAAGGGEIEYPVPRDLVATVRGYMPPEGERGPLSISSCPKHLAWAVESLAGRASASHAKTYACLLDVGIGRLWAFPGARDLQRAREAIIAQGDPEAIRWIDTWEFDVPTADTGETTPKVRLPVMGILAPLGKFATVLGFTKSKTAVLGLGVALLDDTDVPIRYHHAQVELLRHLATELTVRAAKAIKYAAQAPNSNGDPLPPRYSLVDIIGAYR